MLTLHYLPDSRAQRVVWMLEELGVDYELRMHPRGRNKLAPASLRAIHPLGKAPVLVDGDLTLAESAHIVLHLAETRGESLLPTEPEAKREHRYWMHFAEGSLAPPLITSYVFDVAAKQVPRLARPVLMKVPNMIRKSYLDKTVERLIDFVEDHLAGREFFVGDALSCADVMMIFGCEAANKRFGGRRPNIRAYVERIHARPAYQVALERPGVPYMFG